MFFFPIMGNISEKKEKKRDKVSGIAIRGIEISFQ